MVTSGIRFNDCHFSEPTCLADWVPPGCAGLFVILARDSNWAPKPYQALYFGEFGNNTQSALVPGNYAWMLGTAGGTKLFVSVLPMPFSTTAQRLALRDELVRAYNPISQGREARTAANHLARKLEGLENQPREEQAAQVLLLLASMNQLLEPPAPPTPRRRIGFLP